jgi:hypothetical protein
MTTPALLGSATVTKELVAQVDHRTTLICLAANGQVRKVDELFDTLNGAFDGPPFHYLCRSSVQFLVPGITTADTEASRTELRRRLEENREKVERQARREARSARPDTPPLVKFPFSPPPEIRASARAVQLAKARHAKAVKAEPAFTEAISDVAKQTNGRMAGLEFRLKTQGSIAEKIEREVVEHARAGVRISYEQARDNLNDINRYTVTFRQNTYGSSQAAFRQQLSDRGWTLVKDKNFWQPGGPYRGHNTQWKAPDGSLVEVQFHTKQSFDVKMGQHDVYNRLRVIDPDSGEAANLTQRMVDDATAIKMPQGAMQHGNRADPAFMSEFAANARAMSFIEQL